VALSVACVNFPWDGFFFYTVERAKDSLYVPSEIADPLSPISPEVARGAVSLYPLVLGGRRLR